ncbi:MAG TPA: alpha/beta hydrolase [Acidimicrobiales bacterium]|nr:alpha/beta hydrolase [Acidimicrobiales bacterium]
MAPPNASPLDRWAMSAWRRLSDPRIVGVAQAVPRTIGVLRRNSATKGFEGYPVSGPSAGLALQVLVDEVLISVMRKPALFPRGDDYDRAGREIGRAYEMWRSEGWLDDPASFHEAPPAGLHDLTVTEERTFRRQRFEHLSFESAYRPHEGEPGGERWLSYTENRTAHAYVVRAARPGRPWLVCLHGFGMGVASMDLPAFRADRMQRDLEVNLALVVLPMHGPRRIPGTTRGEGLMSINLLDSLHGLAQAAFDTRSVIRWIRDQDNGRASAGDGDGGSPRIGVYGLSLGGHVAALTASLEQDLSCVIAGVPVTDLPDLYRRHSPNHVRLRAYRAGALGTQADAVHAVVSPLVLAPKVAKDRRFIFAGAGDRMSTAGQARRLWEHWDRPKIAWYPGGHIGFFVAGAVQRFVTDALADCGMVTQKPDVGARPSPESQASSTPQAAPPT